MTKFATITGAGSGVGRATAQALAQAGWQLALVGRKREALERQVAEMRAELDAEEEEVSKVVAHQEGRIASAASDRAAMAQKRGGTR